MRFITCRSLRLRLLLALTLLTSRPAAAQFLTTDVPHIGVQLAEFAKKASDWAETLGSYRVIRDAYQAATVANDIAGNIKTISNQVRDLTSEGLALQQQIRQDLKRVANVTNLRISNMTDLRNMALNMSSLSLANALPSLGQTRQFTDALTSARTQDVEVVSDALNTASLVRGVTRTASQSRHQVATSAMAQLALENKAQQDYIQQAFDYKKMADDMVAAADEMREATNTDGAMSMTEGERLIVQNNAIQITLKAQEYREKSTQLLSKAAQKGPAQLAAEKALQERHNTGGLNALHHSLHPDEAADY